MPSKRTNDSVDAILQELDRQQAERDVQGSMADRQVDDILRSVGVFEKGGASPDLLGPIELGDLPDVELRGAVPGTEGQKFSTQMLDDLLGDLPSLRAAQHTAPAKPARQAAPAGQPTPAAPKQKVQPQPAKPPMADSRPAAVAEAAPKPAPQPAQPPKAVQQPPVQKQPAQQPQPVQQPPAQRQPSAADQLQQVQQQRPAQPAPQQKAEPRQQPAAPSARDTTTGLGDTTRTGIIKNFLLKMASGGAEADQKAINQGKKEFQRFFEESAAVVPDEKGHLRAPAKRKRGLFGIGSVEETDEFVPINVSLAGPHSGAATPPPAEEEPDIAGMEPLPPVEAGPAPTKKRGLFNRLFAGKNEPEEELYIPESREAEPPAAPHRGVVFEDDLDYDLTGDVPVFPDQPSMQLPMESIRSRYTAGRGNGLDVPPALKVTQEEEAMWPQQEIAFAADTDDDGLYAKLGLLDETKTNIGKPTAPPPAAPAPRGLRKELLDETRLDIGAPAPAQPPAAPAEPDLLKGLLPGTSTLEFLQQMDGGDTAPAPAGPSVYRKKRSTVEFVPGQRAKGPAEDKPYPTPGPVGEPILPVEEAAKAGPAPAEEAPAAPQPAPVTGFTVQMDAAPKAEDTQFFLDAYGEARARHKRAAPAAEEAAPGTGEVPLQPAGQAQGLATGEIPLQPAPAAEPATMQFVRGVESIIEQQDAKEQEAYYRRAAEILTDPTGKVYPQQDNAPQLDGVPEDEQSAISTSPFVAAPHTAQHSYDKPEDAPAVRRDLERQDLVLSISAIITGVLALVLIYLGVAAFGTANTLPAPLDLAAGKAPLLVTMLILLAAACGLSWRTMLWGLSGLVRTPSPDSMPALAAVGGLVQLLVFLIWPDLYDPARFCLVGGSAALLLCANTAGKALDAHSLRAGFELVSAKNEHAVARRLMESGLLQAATRGLGEPRPCVLISRPTELFKGFLTNASARRPSDKNQQQFARILLGCAAVSTVFTLLYHQDPGKAVTALAAVLCLGTPLASTLLSALPAHLMQRSAAQVGAVIPGWHDIRQLGRINVIHLTSRDLFPEGSVRLCGIKPVHKEYIDRAIIYAASILAGGCRSMQDIFLGMIGDDRKLLAKVDERQTVYGKGYVGWIDGERVLVGNRRLMEDYGVGIPSLDYEQRHTVNQRRFIYLAVSGKLFSVFQVAYQRDPDTAAVLDGLRQNGMSLVVDCDDFNCDAALLETVYALPTGTVKVLTAEERETLEPATAWLPESSGNMLHLGNLASFVGGLEAAASAAEGERRASMVLSASVLLSAVLALILSVPKGGITSLPLLALVLYQVAWGVLALIFPMIQRY